MSQSWMGHKSLIKFLEASATQHLSIRRGSPPLNSDVNFWSPRVVLHECFLSVCFLVCGSNFLGIWQAEPDCSTLRGLPSLPSPCVPTLLGSVWNVRVNAQGLLNERKYLQPLLSYWDWACEGTMIQQAIELCTHVLDFSSLTPETIQLSSVKWKSNSYLKGILCRPDTQFLPKLKASLRVFLHVC